MRSVFLKFLLPIAVLFSVTALSFALSGPVTADEGGKEGHGGDSYAEEFFQIGNSIVDILNENPGAFPEVNSYDLQTTIHDTRIISLQQTILNGAAVDAINYPNNGYIEMSRSRWDENGENKLRKYILVFHEYLGIMRIELDRYTVSQRLTQALLNHEAKLDNLRNLATLKLQQLIPQIEATIPSALPDLIKLIHEVRQTKNYKECVSPGIFDSRAEMLIACLRTSTEIRHKENLIFDPSVMMAKLINDGIKQLYSVLQNIREPEDFYKQASDTANNMISTYGRDRKPRH